MSQQELLSRIVKVLEDLGIDYMVTGSYVSSLQGAPRMTHDLDIVVALSEESADRLYHAFLSPAYYVSEQAVRAALQERRMFNVIELASANKVDFWMLTDEPFDTSRFSRKRVVETQGLRLKVPTPEDTILAKLRWTQESGGSEKHFIDAMRVYELQSKGLDFAYMNEWAKRLGVEDLWDRIQAEAEPL